MIVMEPAGMQTYRSLQAGRGLAAVMVVLFHTTSFLGGDPRYWRRQWLSDRFAGLALGVEFFFVLSGAVILLAHRGDIGRPATIPSYLWKRIRRVYPVYWLILTALVLEYTLRPGLGAAWQSDPRVIASGYLLVYCTTSFHLTLPVAWTLCHEVLFYAAFGALLAGRRVGTLILTAWFGLSLLMLVHPWSVYFGAYLFSPLHLLFGSGMLAGWLLRRRDAPAPGLLTAVGICIFASAVVLAGRRGDIDYSTELLAGAGVTLLVLGAARLEEQGRLAVSRPLQLLGDASYSILGLTQGPF
jgi:exopolysaccharide production protein ExoZ